MNRTIQNFMNDLSSKNPVPGGGGASALIGAVGVSLCSMVANLTLGKPQYAIHQEDIEVILDRAEKSLESLLNLIQKDAEVFEPLSVAYYIPQDYPNREQILEQALLKASSVPMEIIEEIYQIIDIMEQLLVKGSKLAISDVGVAASACRSALEGAIMNVYINTKLMKNREIASVLNTKAEVMLTQGVKRCNSIFQQITQELKS